MSSDPPAPDTELKTRRLAASAYETLLQRILMQDLPGGAVIQERKLADLMGVSRTPLREAIGRLEGEGLLIRLTDRLTTVRRISVQDYLHTLDIRALLEPEAAALATGNILPADIEALESGLAEFIDRPDSSAELYWDYDDKLHGTIAVKSRNPFLAKSIAEMRQYTMMYERQTVPPRVTWGIEDHRRIIAGLASGEPAKARKAMLDHIRNARKTALENL